MRQQDTPDFKKSQPNSNAVAIKALSKRGGLIAYTLIKIAPYGGGAYAIDRLLGFANDHWQQLIALIF